MFHYTMIIDTDQISKIIHIVTISCIYILYYIIVIIIIIIIIYYYYYVLMLLVTIIHTK